MKGPAWQIRKHLGSWIQIQILYSIKKINAPYQLLSVLLDGGGVCYSDWNTWPGSIVLIFLKFAKSLDSCAAPGAARYTYIYIYLYKKIAVAAWRGSPSRVSGGGARLTGTGVIVHLMHGARLVYIYIYIYIHTHIYIYLYILGRPISR